MFWPFLSKLKVKLKTRLAITGSWETVVLLHMCSPDIFCLCAFSASLGGADCLFDFFKRETLLWLKTNYNWINIGHFLQSVHVCASQFIDDSQFQDKCKKEPMTKQFLEIFLETPRSIWKECSLEGYVLIENRRWPPAQNKVIIEPYWMIW